jgi:hypothetical protein
MDTAAPAIFLLARLLLMTDTGTELLSEHRARLPHGATGLVREEPGIEGLPGAVHVLLSPSRVSGQADLEPTDPGGEPAGPSLRVGLEVRLWDSAADAAAGRRPREINIESAEIEEGGSALIQIAEDAVRGQRLILSLSAPVDGAPPRAPPVGPFPAPGRIGFSIEAYRGTASARELLEKHLLMTLERSPVSWESRWQIPIPRADGKGLAYRDEGVTLRLLPLVTDSGWITVEAELSALLYARGESEPLRLSSTVSRTIALGIPFEISLALPGEEGGEGGGDDRADDATSADRERPSIIVEVTPYRPGS